jgi:hypothetical protein
MYISSDVSVVDGVFPSRFSITASGDEPVLLSEFESLLSSD